MPAMAAETLPLFDQFPDEQTGRAAARAPQVDAHLRAARKLSKQIRRTVDGSPQQTKAAHLICQHLLAMLHTDGIEQRPCTARTARTTHTNSSTA
jgi:hypothetical protein